MFGLEVNFIFFLGILILIFLIRGLVMFCFSIINGFMKLFVELFFGGMIWIFWICGMLFLSFGFICIVYFVFRGLGLEVGVIRFVCNLEIFGVFWVFVVVFFRLLLLVVGLLFLFLVNLKKYIFNWVSKKFCIKDKCCYFF